MTDMAAVGRVLMVSGIVLVLIGMMLGWGRQIPGLGRLPGDISIGGRGWKVYAPLGSSLLISLVASIVLGLLFRR